MSCYTYKRPGYKHWYGAINLPNSSEKRLCIKSKDGKKFTDRVAATIRLREIEAEMREELVDGTGKALHDAAKLDISTHLAAFLADKEAVRRSKDRIRVLRVLIGKLCRECGWQRLDQIQGEDFERWRSEHKKYSAKTLVEYLGCMTTFIKWLRKHGLIKGNPFEMVERGAVRGLKTYLRRAWTHEQCVRLLELCPIERRPIYHLVLAAGMRRREIEKLKWADVVLDGDSPYIMMQGATTKNRNDFRMPIRSDLLLTLKEYSQGRERQGLLVPKVPRLRDMLKDWRAADIPLYDEDGRKADFHALRVTFCTRLMEAKVNPKIVQLLMRHRDYRQTMQTYTDAGVFDLNSALSAPVPLREKICTVNCSVEGVQKGEKESFAVQTEKVPENTQAAKDKERVLKSLEVSGHKNGSGGWNRTNGLQVMSLTSYLCSTPQRDWTLKNLLKG